MKYFLAFKYMTVFSRELDGTGVNVGDEVVSEIIERVNARLIAGHLTQDWNMIGWYPYQTRVAGLSLEWNAPYSSSSSQSTYWGGLFPTLLTTLGNFPRPDPSSMATTFI
jgi:hypothetical protein